MDSVKRILDQILNQNPELRTRVRESKALSGWEEAVGPQISKHSRVFKVEDGILFIEVDHPAWRSELHHRKLQILERLNSAVTDGQPAIRDLFFMETRAAQMKESSSRPGARTKWGSRSDPEQSGKQLGKSSPGKVLGKSETPSKLISPKPSKR